jgi:hypothetical protein
LVATEEGFCPIENIHVGDLVWAGDEFSGRVLLKPVVGVFERATTTIVVFQIGDQKIKATPDHPFWVKDSGWVQAKALFPGDLIGTINGQFKAATKIDIRESEEHVFNLEVEHLHTFFVSQERLLVHNNCSAGSSSGGLPKPSLSAYKEALREVHGEVGKLPRGAPGKFGSPQAGTSKKGYRLDPPHPNKALDDPESKYHINWWDYTEGKRGRGGRSGAVPIQDK